MTSLPGPNNGDFVQLVQRRYEVLRVPRGADPVFQFTLEPHERIVGIFHHWTSDFRRRETVDHHVIAWVEVRLVVAVE